MRPLRARLLIDSVTHMHIRACFKILRMSHGHAGRNGSLLCSYFLDLPIDNVMTVSRFLHAVIVAPHSAGLAQKGPCTLCGKQTVSRQERQVAQGMAIGKGMPNILTAKLASQTMSSNATAYKKAGERGDKVPEQCPHDLTVTCYTTQTYGSNGGLHLAVADLVSYVIKRSAWTTMCNKTKCNKLNRN
jgi:hypothetical protein